MNSVKSALIVCCVLLAVLAAGSEQVHGIEIEKSSRAIVKISSGSTVRTGVVVQNRRKHKEAVILTAYSNIENSESIEIEFPSIPEKRWKGNLFNKDEDVVLDKKDESQDAVLIVIKNPPADIPEMYFGDAKNLDEVHEVYCFKYGEKGELVRFQVPVKEFSGAYIILSVPLDEKAYGGPVFEPDKGRLVGMVQKEKVNQRVCDRVLRSGVLCQILNGWHVPTRMQKVKSPQPPLPPVVDFSLASRFGLVNGTILPFSANWRWKLQRAISFRLTLELAKEGELGTHRFGIIYSEFSSKPMKDNPMGELHSTFIFPVYSYWKTLLSTSVSETRSKRFGAEATLGFGFGRHSLVNGEFPADTLFADFVPHPGMKDTHLEFFAFIMGAALAYYFTNYSAVHLGCDVYHFSMRNHTNYYHSFYIGINLRVGPW